MSRTSLHSARYLCPLPRSRPTPNAPALPLPQPCLRSNKLPQPCHRPTARPPALQGRLLQDLLLILLTALLSLALLLDAFARENAYQLLACLVLGALQISQLVVFLVRLLPRGSWGSFGCCQPGVHGLGEQQMFNPCVSFVTVPTH